MRRDLLTACAGMRAVWSSELATADKLQLAYTAVYCCGYAGRGPLQPFRTLARSVFDRRFVEMLVAASDAQIVDRGWRVVQARDGDAIVERDGVRVLAPATSLATSSPSPGTVIDLRAPAVLGGAISGFVTREGVAPPPHPLTRIYVNLARPSAAWPLSSLGDALDGAGIPFQLKVAAHPAAYRRRDACVVYVSTADRDAALDVVAAEIDGAGAGAGAGGGGGGGGGRGRVELGSAVPVLTERHRPGIGVADEPDDVSSRGESFGQWVSRLLSTAVVDVGDADDSVMAKRMCALIEESGRDPLRPHLRA